MSMHPTRNYFHEFKTGVLFIETGSYRGDGIQLAIDAGFEEVVSMDNDPENVNFCRSRFNLRSHGSQAIGNVGECKVTVLFGDSAVDLWNVLEWYDEPATIWLDAHWQMLEGTEPGPNPWPLLKELQQIRQHLVKTHTILIDDLLMMTHPGVTGWDYKLIYDALRVVNRNYKFRLLANPVIDNLLVAHV